MLNSSSHQTAIPQAQSELNERRKNIVAALQQKWRCEKHSKDQDVYCYSSGSNVCYALTHSNISFWALEIVCISVALLQVQ